MDRLGVWYDWPYSPRPISTYDVEIAPKEFLEFHSTNHRRKGNGWSGGGAFISKKRFTEYKRTDSVNISPANKPMYAGSLIANPPPRPIFSDPAIQLDTLGPELWNQASPAKPLLNFGNAVYELKDLPSMVKQGYETLRNLTVRNDLIPYYFSRNRGSLSLKDVSDYELAVLFGWLPLLSDTIGLFNAQRQMSASIKQVLRDAGRPVRRKFTSDKNSSTSSEVIATGSDSNGTLFSPKFITGAYTSGSFPWTLTRKKLTKVSFAAQFRYFFDDCDHLTADQWNSRIRRRLFGLNPTPAAIYRAMPWSWLIDWFGNIGDNLANLQPSVADRLIADYAFIMRHVQEYDSLSATIGINQGDSSVTRTATTNIGTDLKSRAFASPFGFRVKLDELSPFQLTILGSLGGSRGPSSGFS